LKKIVVNIESFPKVSEIFLGDSIENLENRIKGRRCIIVTESNVASFYREFFPDAPLVEVMPGEKNKSMETVLSIYDAFLKNSVDRSWFVLAIGGGVLLDIAGFAASTFMRGIEFGFVATTLLSQVDASIGGKNGVNFKGYKNLVGTFNQPEFVIIDFKTLKTLPQRELNSGFAEIIKHGAIGSYNLFTYLESYFDKIVALDDSLISSAIRQSLDVKSSIVMRDELEKGERRKLNFGHTLGHAIEKTVHGMLHGEAIAVGMVAAAELSVKRKYLTKEESSRLRRLLERFNLPVRADIDSKLVMDALNRDKKRSGDYIYFVLLKNLGNAAIEKVDIKELEEVVDDLCLRW